MCIRDSLKTAKEKINKATWLSMFISIPCSVGLFALADVYKRQPYTQSLLSAVPYPDPKMAKERQRIILEGDVPSPLHMPTGCAFRTRCKYATEQCAKECPTLTDRGNGHQVACWNK